MGHVIFTLDIQVFIKTNIYSVFRNLKDLDLCIYEDLSYTHGTMETVFAGMTITNINYANI